MAKKKKPTTFYIADLDLIVQIDARVDAERRAHPGRNITRSSVVRELLYNALALKNRRAA